MLRRPARRGPRTPFPPGADISPSLTSAAAYPGRSVAAVTVLIAALAALAGPFPPAAAADSAMLGFATPGPSARASAPDRSPVAISPAPGTPDASPDTQISVLGVPARSVRSVTVIGSASGRHTGRLRAYASAPGASYLLDRSLAPGESVRLRVVVAGRGAINERFTVAHPGVIGPPINIPVIQLPKLQRFVSNPLLLPPRLTVNRAAPHLPGDIFLTPLPAPIIHPGNVNAISIHPVGPGGPMIVGSDGRLIWFHELAPPDVAAALQVARLGHRSVLTWWQGSVSTSAFGQGAGVIADTSYRILHTVHTGNGYAADIHEFQITPDGQAFMIAAAPVRIHRPGTPAGTLWPLQDSVAQEIDIRTGLVMWEWHGYGHIPLRDSDVTPKTSPVYDAYHFNSLNPLPGGRVLISARDTSAVYSVRQAGGAIQWTLGGRASSFRMGPGAVFHFQHDARPLPGHRIGLFDDEAGPPDYARASRGLILALDLRRHRAMVARQYHRGGASLAASEGSLQTLPGGGALVGFGATPWISQFSASGRLVFDAALPADDGSYRALRFDWHATPRTRPAVAARSATGHTDLYVSWNGATEVARWQVRSGRATLVTVADRAFETRIAVPVRTRYTVRALDRAGHVLAESPEVPAP